MKKERRIILMVLVIVISVFLLTGCTGDKDIIDTGDTSNDQITDDSEQLFEPDAGPIIATFDKNSGEFAYLEQVNTTTGEVEIIFTNNNSIGFETTFNISQNSRAIHTRCWYLEQIFDPKLSKMAINWLVESDDSRHVGWINSDGEITDVTSKITTDGSDFAARPQHFNALFDTSGNFMYIDNLTGQMHCLDVETFSEVGTPINVRNSYGNIPYAVMLQPDGSIDVDQSDRLFSSGMVFEIRLASNITITSFSDASVQDIIDNNNVLTLNENGLKIMGSSNLPVSNGEVDTEDGESIPSITPETDYSIRSAAVNNAGDQVAFVAIRGAERTLFLMPMDSRDEPKKLISLDTSKELLFWL